MKIEVKLFSAKWCGPCKIYKPMIRKLMEKRLDGVEFEEYDATEDETILKDLGVIGVPTLVIFNDGIEVDRIINAVRKSEAIDKLQQWGALSDQQSIS